LAPNACGQPATPKSDLADSPNACAKVSHGGGGDDKPRRGSLCARPDRPPATAQPTLPPRPATLPWLSLLLLLLLACVPKGGVRGTSLALVAAYASATTAAALASAALCDAPARIASKNCRPRALGRGGGGGLPSKGSAMASVQQ
jgi:hypothetical protein